MEWGQTRFATWPIACPNILHVLVDATPTIDGQLVCENTWLWQNGTNSWFPDQQLLFVHDNVCKVTLEYIAP